MTYADIDAHTVEIANNYSSNKLVPYIQSEPVFTVVHYDQIVRTIQKLVPVPNPKVLDFGCGTGMFVRRCLKAGLDAEGVDHSPYVRIAQEAFNLPLHCCDLLDAPFVEKEFDVVFSHATFEHLYDPISTGRSLLNLLKPGGVVIFTAIPNFNTLSIKIFKNFFANTPPGHINYFTKSTLINFLTLLGLTEIRVSTYGIDIWYLFHHIRKMLNPQVTPSDSEIVQSNVTNSDLSARLDGLNHKLDDICPNMFARIIALSYTKTRLPNMGVSLYGIATNPR